MTAHRYVDPWTSPLELNPGDRAINPGSLVTEWDGHRQVPVCPGDDLAMTEWTATGEHACPVCGATPSLLQVVHP